MCFIHELSGMDLYFCLKVLTFVLQYECMSVFVRWQVFFVYLLTPSLPIPQLQCHMQTAWIRMRSRINRRLVQIHVIWQSINQWICEVKMKQTIFFRMSIIVKAVNRLNICISPYSMLKMYTLRNDCIIEGLKGD